MTSEATMESTKKFFSENDFFGLGEKNIITFFEQFTLPCTNFKGKILLSEKHKIACAPGIRTFSVFEKTRVAIAVQVRDFVFCD